MFQLDDITAQEHILSIRFAPDGFSFFVLCATDDTVKAFKHTPIDIHQDAVVTALTTLRSEEIFSYPYKEVRVLIDFPSVTTIPSSLYDEDKQEELFALNVDAGINDFIIANHSSAFDLEILFSIPKELYRFFDNNFNKIAFVHKLTTMLDQANAYPNKAQEQLFISYSELHFSAIALRNNSLIYHNCFNLVVPEDFTYYFLLIFQELKFDQYQARVLIDGTIDKNSKELTTAKEYINQIDFAKIPRPYTFSDNIVISPEHYHSNLFSLPHCAL